MERHDFEQRLVENIADEIAEIAISRFREVLADGGEIVFEIDGGGPVRMVAADHFDVGGMLINVETEDGQRYLVRFEIRSGHYAFEAVPFDA
jgi:hypothetical protein